MESLLPSREAAVPQRKEDEVGCENQDTSDKEVLQLANWLWKEWRQVAIYLDLDSNDLDTIQVAKKDVTMQKLPMLVK